MPGRVLERFRLQDQHLGKLPAPRSISAPFPRIARSSGWAIRIKKVKDATRDRRVSALAGADFNSPAHRSIHWMQLDLVSAQRTVRMADKDVKGPDSPRDPSNADRGMELD